MERRQRHYPFGKYTIPYFQLFEGFWFGPESEEEISTGNGIEIIPGQDPVTEIPNEGNEPGIGGQPMEEDPPVVNNENEGKDGQNGMEEDDHGNDQNNQDNENENKDGENGDGNKGEDQGNENESKDEFEEPQTLPMPTEENEINITQLVENGEAMITLFRRPDGKKPAFSADNLGLIRPSVMKQQRQNVKEIYPVSVEEFEKEKYMDNSDDFWVNRMDNCILRIDRTEITRERLLESCTHDKEYGDVLFEGVLDHGISRIRVGGDLTRMIALPVIHPEKDITIEAYKIHFDTKENMKQTEWAVNEMYEESKKRETIAHQPNVL